MSITKTREFFSLPNVHYTLFCILKAPVLRCNIGTFTEQLINENEEISKLV